MVSFLAVPRFVGVNRNRGATRALRIPKFLCGGNRVRRGVRPKAVAALGRWQESSGPSSQLELGSVIPESGARLPSAQRVQL